jgi:hypothetical protein
VPFHLASVVWEGFADLLDIREAFIQGQSESTAFIKNGAVI